jgi:pyrimidine-specific ribonucleoside hydrolase
MAIAYPRAVDVVLDVDTGVDDALAILFAVRHPDLDVRAISCVTGNVAVEQVVTNTLKVLDAAGAPEIPVGRGCRQPLLEPVAGGRSVHGADGLADLGLPASTRRPADVHAVELLRAALAPPARPVILVTLAPLTNIALLLRMYPEAAAGIDRLVLMGGMVRDRNPARAVDFNVAADPEAAAIVVGSGLPITMYGLDVFYDVTTTRADGERLIASPHPAARLAGQLILHQAGRFGDNAATLGDAGALMAAAVADGLRTARGFLHIELAGPFRGRTRVDLARYATSLDDLPEQGPDLVDIALEVDGPRYRDLFLSTISSGRARG